jgi:hypothetical protein
VRLAQDVARPPVASPELGADQGTATELELSPVVVNRAQVVVIEFPLEHREQAREAVRAEFRRLLVRLVPQTLEHVCEQLEYAEGLPQQRLGRVAKPEVLRLSLAFDRFDGERVELPDDLGVLEAVSEDRQAVADRLGVYKAREEHLLDDLAQVLVPSGHGVEERGQLQILLQGRGVRGRGLLGIEVAIAIQEVCLHWLMRLLSRSYDRPYLSARAQA